MNLKTYTTDKKIIMNTKQKILPCCLLSIVGYSFIMLLLCDAKNISTAMDIFDDYSCSFASLNNNILFF